MLGSATRNNMLVIGLGYVIYAVSLLFQPSRWSATPAYHDLLAVMSQRAWGGLFALISVLLVLGVWQHTRRWLVISALTLAIAITLGWDLAFLVRWISSDNTTPVTWVSWSVNLYMLGRAAALLDTEEVSLPHVRGKSG